MLKLTKKDRRELQSILDQLNEGIEFIMNDRTEVMVKTSMTSLDVFKAPYYPEDQYAKISKHYGSKLAFLISARSKLQRALAITELQEVA